MILYAADGVLVVAATILQNCCRSCNPDVGLP